MLRPPRHRALRWLDLNLLSADAPHLLGGVVLHVRAAARRGVRERQGVVVPGERVGGGVGDRREAAGCGAVG